MQKFFKKSCAVLVAVFMLGTAATLFSRAEAMFTSIEFKQYVDEDGNKSEHYYDLNVGTVDDKVHTLYELTKYERNIEVAFDIVKVTDEFDEIEFSRDYDTKIYNFTMIRSALSPVIEKIESDTNIRYTTFYFEDEITKTFFHKNPDFTVSKSDKCAANGEKKWQAIKSNPNFIPSASFSYSSSSSAMSSTEPSDLLCPSSSRSDDTQTLLTAQTGFTISTTAPVAFAKTDSEINDKDIKIDHNITPYRSETCIIYVKGKHVATVAILPIPYGTTRMVQLSRYDVKDIDLTPYFININIKILQCFRNYSNEKGLVVHCEKSDHSFRNIITNLGFRFYETEGKIEKYKKY